jgi:N-acetylglucosamine-6-phosphate deacetylase
MIVTGGRVVTPSGVVDGGAVLIREDRIVAVGRSTPPISAGDTLLDASGGWVVPGFLDLQVNGGVGIDLTAEPQRMGELAADLVRQGVTSFLPTVVTAPAPRRAAALSAWAARVVPPGAAEPLGLHFEGPMISPGRRGAHPAEHVVAPSDDVVRGWSRRSGVAMVTLAPELPGAGALIRSLARRGVVVAIGHTDASAHEVRQAVDAGATYLTHLFNAMRPFHHRDPGPIGAALGGDGLVAGLIADGAHVDPDAVRLAWRALGPDRISLVTDAVAARGIVDGRDPLGPHFLGSGRRAPAARTADGVLAGGLLTLDALVRNLVAMTSCSVPDAVRTVTATPADVLGLRDRGRLQAGSRADLVVLDAALEVEAVVVGGVTAWTAAAGDGARPARPG